jgi:archaellum biogenesis ATPase FlaH
MTPEEYLQQHALSEEYVTSRLAWSLEEDRIVIPHFDESGNGLFNRYRYLVGDAKFKADTGSHATLYGAWLVKNKQSVVLCEGEPDCAKLLQEGIPAVTSGGVTSFSAKLAEPLRDKEVILLLDNDEPGQKAIGKYCDILERVNAKIRIAHPPEGTKDVCDYFVTGGDREGLRQILQLAIPYDVWLDQNKPEEYRIESGEEILARELPNQAWLIDRILPVDGITFIVGAEGTGKSFYTLTMGDAVANKEKWLKTFVVKKNTKVLFIDKENVVRRIQSRMKGLQITGENMYWLAYPQYFSMIDEKSEDGFSAFAHEVQRFVAKQEIGLIVIDSFADVMMGNENSAGDTQVFFDGLRQLFPDKAILVIHHASKPSQGVTRTAAQKTRGSTNIMAQVYSALHVEQIPRAQNAYAIEHIKAGDTEKVKKFRVEMEIHTDMYDPSKSWVTNLRYAGEIEDVEEKNLLAEEMILTALATGVETQRSALKDVCIAQGVSPATFERVIKKMKDDGAIEVSPDPANGNRKLIKIA